MKAQLIGYAGMLVDDALVAEDNPKYRFPVSRDHDGKRYDFDKSLFLYNGCAIGSDAEEITVVSNFPSVWWLWQHGYTNTIALMGSGCSPEQARLIVGLVPRSGRVKIFTDGTKVGRYCGDEVLGLVAPYRFCRRVMLEHDRTPTDCRPDELSDLL
jgi:DNA primase